MGKDRFILGSFSKSTVRWLPNKPVPSHSSLLFHFSGGAIEGRQKAPFVFLALSFLFLKEMKRESKGEGTLDWYPPGLVSHMLIPEVIEVPRNINIRVSGPYFYNLWKYLSACASGVNFSLPFSFFFSFLSKRKRKGKMGSWFIFPASERPPTLALTIFPRTLSRFSLSLSF